MIINNLMSYNLDFMADMFRQPLDRLKYQTCMKVYEDDGTFQIIRLDMDDEFKKEYDIYIDMLIDMLHKLDHHTYYPFIAMWRENGIENVDGWFNCGIKMSSTHMIRFYIRKEDSKRFNLILGHMIRFWDYSGCNIMEGDEAVKEFISLYDKFCLEN